MPARVRHAVREFFGPWPVSQIMAGPGASELSQLVSDFVRGTMNPDDEIRGSARRLREKAQQLERSNAWIAGWLDHLVNGVIGPNGIHHQARVLRRDGKMNADLNAHIEDRFYDWTRAVTRDGQLTLMDYEDLALRSAGTAGEVFVRAIVGPQYRHGLALDFIDAELVDEEFVRVERDGFKSIRNGIEIDRDGRRVAYHCLSDYGGQGNVRHLRIPAEEVRHVYRPRRVNQVRGISWAAPILVSLRSLDGYEMAELIQAQIAASKGGFFENIMEGNEPDGEWAKNESSPITMEAAPGVAEKLPRGWTFKEWSPTHPTAQFPGFVKSNLRKIATGLGISYNQLANDLEGVTYSSLRSGFTSERDGYRRRQTWWIDSFREWIYPIWMRQSMLAGELKLPSPDPVRYAAHEFIPRGFPWVDPYKDIAAAILEIQWGLNSRTRITAEAGRDLEETLKDLKREDEAAALLDVLIRAGVTAPGGTDNNAQEGDAGDQEAGSRNGHARRAVLAALRNGGIQ